MEKTFKPQAVLCIFNHGGIAIQVNDKNDSVRYQWFDNKPSKKWQIIKYNKHGLPFIRVKNVRYYLDQFMRV